ncbi:hypothetical protein NUW58_g563 [Xylaria curta]|uniref:Uncharacterized protein n=1 Tax=Xylaria curta TaxID=42375 RepID=A0ACC1PPY4_9PEZI|nr:hypothetical protein NUW58_g563 [Xylaria curta]
MNPHGNNMNHVETPLSQLVPRALFRHKIWRLAMIQRFLPYHLDMLSFASRDTRTHFSHLQNYCTQALGLSLKEIRECMKVVDISELEGFNTELIMRPFGYGIGDIPPRPDTPTPPVIIQTTANTQGDLGPVELYDEDGFLVDFTYTPDGLMPGPNSTDEVQTNVQPSDIFNDLQVTPPTWQPVQSPFLPTEPEDPHLSDALRDLVRRAKGDPTTKRSTLIVFLTSFEFQGLDTEWVEMRRGRGRPGPEPADETALLDSWVERHQMPYWQLEGNFLCKLVQLVYKDKFAVARQICLIDNCASLRKELASASIRWELAQQTESGL